MKDELKALQQAVDSYMAAPTKMIVEAIDMKRTIERFAFNNAAELKTFLNGFKLRDLETVNIDTETGAPLVVSWEEEILTDGSIVNNMVIS